MEGPWTRDEASASGSVFEDRVYALLTEQSRGNLHVFRPLLDRGVDALLHRLSDGAYIPVQAKGRTSLNNGFVQLSIAASSVADDLIVVVGGEIVDGGVGPTMLVVPTPALRRLALLTTMGGVPDYSLSFGMNLHSRSRWRPWLVPSDRLLEKFGVPLGLPELAISEKQPPPRRSILGFLGEAEVIRRLAEGDRLNLFRPFPDLEMVEIAIRNVDNGKVVGLQIKAANVEADNRHPEIQVSISSFRPAPTTFFVVVAWIPKERRFHNECLVVPSEELTQFARPYGRHYKFMFKPGSTNQPRLDKYRRALSDLCSEVEGLL
jgi:hypothetical protein